LLRSELGQELSECGSPDGPYLYLDDCSYTGKTIRNDIVGWLDTYAPVGGRLHIVVIGYHRGGWYFANQVDQAAYAKVKGTVTWHPFVVIEDRKKYIDTSEVLRPAELPHDS